MPNFSCFSRQASGESLDVTKPALPTTTWIEIFGAFEGLRALEELRDLKVLCKET